MAENRVLGARLATALYQRCKTIPPARLRTEGHKATVRLSEHRIKAEKARIAERNHRLTPVHDELASVIRKSPEFAGVVRAVDALQRP